MVKKIFKIIIGIILILAIIIAAYLVFMTVTDYRPEEIIRLDVENNKEDEIKKKTSLSIVTYNIGYCGLDKERDFFMDGGTESRSISKEKTMENLKGNTEFLKKENSSFILLQEIDMNSTRSYHVDEYRYMKNNLKDYASVFALNYKVPWVPVPIRKPHGKVEAGLATFSKYNIQEANRYQYPGEEKWPRQLALLDRCFIESKFKVEDGKELIIINSHLSAYDKGGVIRVQQLEFLKKYINKKYNEGNYIVIGGDWNHLIPGTDPNLFQSTQEWPEWLKKIPEDFKPEGFQWAADELVPSNRTLDIPYKKGVNYLSVIDGFLVSPNIQVNKVKGYSLEFENSDHNPVKMEFMLK
ncbi:endonuclease/exonuclease/phosphatase family protein [Clostridium sp. ZS2-4]|uniref:endonuclease/exonuclease/phosphatase family protein n=1 Tax=Clostridium sp. ZS2-4 TaxID=2987703 RepID=UPI00227B66D0|nr:endonuclease/exonuclease/phosphatase family protein [Clostridium sp. ZS2-4]MCY6355157.1 endonuclease/exonuclease/phosphatase family protein [Clostridium sp. ZS2-4]